MMIMLKRTYTLEVKIVTEDGLDARHDVDEMIEKVRDVMAHAGLDAQVHLTKFENAAP